MKDLLNQITSKEMSTAKRMGYVNNFTKVMYSTCKNLSMFASPHLLCMLQTGKLLEEQSSGHFIPLALFSLACIANAIQLWLVMAGKQ